MQQKQKRIGIIGGTFDPIHHGHLMIAENAIWQYALDEIVFIPTGPSPHKDDAHITAGEIRCDMVLLGIEDNPGFHLSKREIEAHEVSYTYKTLQALHQERPDVELFFLMGGDSLESFEYWRNPKQILEVATLLVAVRDDMDIEQIRQKIQYLTDKYDGKICLLNTPNFSVSSHNIRERVRTGQSIRYLVPDQVRRYIERNHLYQ